MEQTVQEVRTETCEASERFDPITDASNLRYPIHVSPLHTYWFFGNNRILGNKFEANKLQGYCQNFLSNNISLFLSGYITCEMSDSCGFLWLLVDSFHREKGSSPLPDLTRCRFSADLMQLAMLFGWPCCQITSFSVVMAHRRGRVRGWGWGRGERAMYCGLEAGGGGDLGVWGADSPGPGFPWRMIG